MDTTEKGTNKIKCLGDITGDHQVPGPTEWKSFGIQSTSTMTTWGPSCHSLRLSTARVTHWAAAGTWWSTGCWGMGRGPPPGELCWPCWRMASVVTHNSFHVPIGIAYNVVGTFHSNGSHWVLATCYHGDKLIFFGFLLSLLLLGEKSFSCDCKRLVPVQGSWWEQFITSWLFCLFVAKHNSILWYWPLGNSRRKGMFVLMIGATWVFSSQ